MILHCKNCGHRKNSIEQELECELCKSKIKIAGPLWIGKIFDKEFKDGTNFKSLKKLSLWFTIIGEFYNIFYKSVF